MIRTTKRMTPYATFVMFLWPVVRVVDNVPSSGKISCESIRCPREKASSDNCPQWHACDTHTGLCRYCSRCNPKDADDGARFANCQYPTECLTAYDPLPSDMCPFIKVNEAYQCSGDCVPCGGTLGYFLGTVCRLSCADGDSEAIACTFVNEIAQWKITSPQWNITRTPRWTEYEPYTLTPRSIPPKEEGSSEPAYPNGPTKVTAPNGVTLPPTATSGLATTDIIIVAVAMTVVVIVSVVGVAVIWRRRRSRSRKQPLTPTSPPTPPPPLSSPPPAPSPSMEPNEVDEDEVEMCPFMLDFERRPRPTAQIHDERSTEDIDAASLQNRQPVEISDHETSDHEAPGQISSFQEPQQDQPNVFFLLEDQQGQKMMDSAEHVNVGYGNGTRTAREYPDNSGLSSTNIISLHSDDRSLANCEQNGGVPRTYDNFLKYVLDGGYNVCSEGEETSQKQINEETIP